MMRHDERWTVPPIAARAWTVVQVTDALAHEGRAGPRRTHLAAVALRRVVTLVAGTAHRPAAR
jgi:hypothetical protein